MKAQLIARKDALQKEIDEINHAIAIIERYDGLETYIPTSPNIADRRRGKAHRFPHNDRATVMDAIRDIAKGFNGSFKAENLVPHLRQRGIVMSRASLSGCLRIHSQLNRLYRGRYQYSQNAA